MNPTLRQLRAFVALARTGSFTLAAEYLHITQSALSGLIRELEQTLGARVVDRSTRKVELTDIGRDLSPLFTKMLDDLDGALADVADRTRLRKGLVRVAAPQLMSCTLLPQAIAAYRAQHPDIQLKLIDCPVEDVSSRVLSGEVDFGIGPERDISAPLHSTPLFDMPFHAVFPAGHALESLPQLTWQDLAAWPFISLQGQFTERLLNDMQGGPDALRDAALKPANEVTFMTTALAMVAAGLGVTVALPYAAPLIQLHGLKMRELTAPAIRRRFLVYTRGDRSPSPASESFMAFVLEFVKLL
jgi:DNA-binding transcriptional LysR family regulator